MASSVVPSGNRAVAPESVLPKATDRDVIVFANAVEVHKRQVAGLPRKSLDCSGAFSFVDVISGAVDGDV